MPLPLIELARPPVVTPPVPGYVGWWDASDLSTVLTVTGNQTTTWIDKGSGLHNLTQATAASRPLSGVKSIGQLNALWFDGTDDQLIGTQPASVQPVTCIVAAQSTATANQRDLFIFRDAANGDGRIYRPSGGTIDMYAGGPTISSSIAWGVLPHVVTCVLNGASSKISVDGRAATTGNPGAALANGTGWTVGSFRGSEYWQGYIGEILVYATALSDANRQAVEAYMRIKWMGHGA